MRLPGILMAYAALAGAASNDTFLIKDADVYPVTSPEMKGVSLLVKDGKIAEIGPKLVVPKGTRVVDGKGLRVYPGMIDSATQLGLSEVPAVRETVDTGELGEMMPQLRALASVNPDSALFGIVRVNGITSAMTFPTAGRGGGGRGAAGQQFISGQVALIHTAGWTWEEMAVQPSAAMCVQFPNLGGRGGRGAIPEEILQMLGESGAAGSYTQMLRTYQQEVARLTDFFEEARRYQKAKAAHDPGFVPNLKYEAMLPVLERKTPLAVSVSNARTIHDAMGSRKSKTSKS